MSQKDRIPSDRISHRTRAGALRGLLAVALAAAPLMLEGCATQAGSGLRPVKVTETSGCSLCVAAYQGNLTQTTYLLQHGANPNATFNGRTPLAWAILSKTGVRWDIVLMLLHYHSNPNTVVSANDWNITPIILAAEPDGTPANDAIDIRALEALIRAGADVNVKTSSGDTALIWASSRENQTIVADLLKAKADPNIRNNRGFSGLDLAVDNLGRPQESIPIMRMLLASGAKPDSALKQLALMMRNGLTAHGSVPHGTQEALRLLLAYGAEPQNVRNPLLLSVIGDRPDLAKILINAGDPIDLTDEHGRTALNLAVKADDLAQAKLLLNFGSGFSIDTDDPLAQAYMNEDLPMVRLLIQSGAWVQSVFVLDWPPKRSDLPKNPALASFYLKSEQPYADIRKFLSGSSVPPVTAVLSMLRSFEKEPIPALRRTIFVPIMARRDLMPAPPKAAQDDAIAGNALWAKAKSRTDVILAADKYEEAADLAPWVRAYQRNLCLLEYAAGEYSRSADDCSAYIDAFEGDATVSGILAKLTKMSKLDGVAL